jgi:HTH-type transcriptional regulator, cell division transcriptional repressor
VSDPSGAGANLMSKRLREARRTAGLTQRELAKRAGVGLATIRRIEQTGMEPRLGTVRRMAATLGVRVAWLIEGDEPVKEGTKKT